MMEPPPTKEAAVATISVYWDIKGCPVPDGYDARRVVPCIKRKLRKLGYSGPITITAVGVLSEVPRDILEATGVSLHHVADSYFVPGVAPMTTRRLLKQAPLLDYFPENASTMVSDEATKGLF
ncbi:NYN domain limkain-b1-type [Arabidopsis thaliana x Arabidopsis arenosa]|uniref:NYN domain limkain-b1-type n=1 Tax=Arabidopsis thaliana x Arabidopsis arenosa TaxID=1240361 RepID=A0A8T2BY23_9BRAS|nr:NYN domain limkain-b1-type [Arabidopsis thaliana x Arabidopsis arenosa]